MKKIFVSFLSLLLAGQVWAQEFTVGNFNFTIIEDADNEVLVGKAPDYNPVGALEIPSTVEIDSTTYTVTGIDVRAFYYCDSLTSVTIPSTVTNIEIGAFGDCKRLVSISIPNSVKKIGGGAFYECAHRTSGRTRRALR